MQQYGDGGYGEDIDFGKKWMFAIAMTLKKGANLDIIHNLDRRLMK